MAQPKASIVCHSRQRTSPPNNLLVYSLLRVELYLLSSEFTLVLMPRDLLMQPRDMVVDLLPLFSCLRFPTMIEECTQLVSLDKHLHFPRLMRWSLRRELTDSQCKGFALFVCLCFSKLDLKRTQLCNRRLLLCGSLGKLA